MVLGVGGGAVIDLAKAAAALIPSDCDVMEHLEVVGEGQPLQADPLPMIAIPTTAGTGAEVTKNAVIAVAQAARKVSLRDDRMLPRLPRSSVWRRAKTLPRGMRWPMSACRAVWRWRMRASARCMGWPV